MHAVPPMAPPAVVKSPRNLHLDFFRGAALLVILYDHVLCDALISLPLYVQATPIFWGLACAAMIFVFISGQVYGLVYGKTYDREGLGITMKRSLWRVWQLYLANFVTFVAVWLTVRLLQSQRLVEGFMSNELQMMHERWHGRAGPFLAFAEFARIPHLFDVLPLYMFFVAIGPLIIAGLSKWPRTTIFASVAIYTAAQFGLSMPMRSLGLHHFFFNPFAWQLVFTGGIVLARLKPKIPRSIPVLIAGTLLILVVALRVWVIPYLVFHDQLAASPDLEVNPSWADRGNLHFVRILYFAVLAYVAVNLLPRREWFWKSLPVRGICLLGRHTLLGFCVGVWFSWVSDPMLIHLHGTWLDAMVAFAAGTGLTVAVVLLAERRVRARDRESRSLTVTSAST
jgi:hypothetical protein